MIRLKKTAALLLSLLLLAALALPTAAADLPIILPGQSGSDNSGADNGQTEKSDGLGDPIAPAQPDGESGVIYPTAEPTPANENLVWLSSSMSYDTQTREFVYPVADSGNEVRSSAADGMIVTGTVKVSGATLLIYKDGELQENVGSNITEPGEYVVMAQYGSQTPRLFTFTLAGKAISTVYAYNLPSGMIVNSAARDGEDISFDATVVPMREDGLYHVVYECVSTGAIYVLDLNVDRTPPELQFDGKIDDHNRVHSALRFSGAQEGDVLYVRLDGTPIDVPVHGDGTGELTTSGSYIITVFDEAGNSTEYGYTVMLYFNASSLAFFAVLIASLITVIVYVCIKRRRLEIG